MLINVQFLRFFAALVVVFYHASAHVQASGAALGPLFSLGQAVGFAGVDMFFVISGFIMVYTTRDEMGGARAIDFLRRRVARIYSGYWPFFLITLVMIGLLKPERFETLNLLASAFLWPKGQPVLPVSWTLTYEMIFYLGFTVLLLLTPARRAQALASGLVLILAWSAWSFWVRGDFQPGNLEQLPLAQAWLASPFLAEFLAGAVAARWLERHPTGRTWAWLLPGIVLLLAGGWINRVLFDGGLEQGYQLLYRVLAFGPGSLLVLIGVVRLEATGVRAPVRISLALGASSYALYLSHTLVFWGFAEGGLHGALQSQPDLVVHCVYLGLSAAIVLFSWAFYRVVERPLHAVVRRLLHAAQPKPLSNASAR